MIMIMAMITLILVAYGNSLHHLDLSDYFLETHMTRDIFLFFSHPGHTAVRILHK